MYHPQYTTNLVQTPVDIGWRCLVEKDPKDLAEPFGIFGWHFLWKHTVDIRMLTSPGHFMFVLHNKISQSLLQCLGNLSTRVSSDMRLYKSLHCQLLRFGITLFSSSTPTPNFFLTPQASLTFPQQLPLLSYLHHVWSHRSKVDCNSYQTIW